MKLKTPVFLILAVLWSGTVSAKSVGERTACTVASNFFSQKYNLPSESLTPTIAYAAPSLRGENGSGPSFYVVNLNTEGFVIVAGDDRVRPILAFSNEGAFVAEDMPAHTRFFLDGYTEDIQHIVDNQQYGDEAIATLLYHCGVAVNMNYGPAASVCNSNKIVAALSTYFSYPATVQYIEREGLSSTVWLNYLKGELDDGAPFMYGGSGNYGGHVWVCDGYRDDDYFHFNWGWGGKQNGYYALTNCSSYGFNSNHAIIIGIRGPELPEAIEEHRVEDVKVFPNPTHGSVCVYTESQPVSEARVYDMFGRMLIQKNLGENEFSIDLSGYKAGTYTLQLVTRSGVRTSKIVKY